MCDITEFNSTCFASVRRAIAVNAKRSMQLFSMTHDQTAEFLKLSQSSIDKLTQSPVFAVEPVITKDCLFRQFKTEQEQDVVELNMAYLMTIRHVASANVRRAAMKSQISVECCEIISTLTVAQIKHIASINRLLFRVSIPARTLIKTNAGKFPDALIAHLPMLSFSMRG